MSDSTESFAITSVRYAAGWMPFRSQDATRE